MAKIYQDFIPPAEGRSYRITPRANGTHAIEDVTPYLQTGDAWSAADATEAMRKPDIILRLTGLSGVGVTVTQGESSVSGVLDEAGTLDLALPAIGIWQMTCTQAGASLVRSVELVWYGITTELAFVGRALADCTWAEIRTYAAQGLAPQCWEIGDSKTVKLTNGTEIQMQIADFNHDTDENDTIIPVTFVSQISCGTVALYGNYGYPASPLKAYVVGTVYNLLPEDVKAVITPVKKMVNKTCNNYDNTLGPEVEKLFVPSPKEMAEGRGTHDYIHYGGGRLYPLFADAAQAVLRNASGTAVEYWLRTPLPQAGTVYYGWSFIGAAGNLTGMLVCAEWNSTAQTRHVRFGFCV